MAPPQIATHAEGLTPEQERVLSKVLWRIVPFLLLCSIFADLDRVNVGVARLFFFGYFLAEQPAAAGRGRPPMDSHRYGA